MFKDDLTTLDLNMEEFTFMLGSLIYPKEMLKIHGGDQDKRKEIFSIYNALYKFSLDRLQEMLNNKSFLLLLAKYLQINEYSRINDKSNMRIHNKAY